MAHGVSRCSQEKKKEVTAFLKGKPGLPFCDDCLRSTLGISRNHLPEKAMNENAVAVGLIREWEVCIVCGRRRVITKAQSLDLGKQ